MNLCQVVPSFPLRRESRTRCFFEDWIPDNCLGNDKNSHFAKGSFERVNQL